MTDPYIQFPHQLMAAKHFQSLTTGETISISSTEKLIWVWMVDRFNFFKRRGSEWFESQSKMAEQTGCSLKTLNSFYAVLKEHGYLTVTTRPSGGCRVSNITVIVRDLELCTVSVKGSGKKSKMAPAASDAPETAATDLVENVPASAPIVFNLPVPAPQAAPRVLKTMDSPFPPRDGCDGVDDIQWSIHDSGTSA